MREVKVAAKLLSRWCHSQEHLTKEEERKEHDEFTEKHKPPASEVPVGHPDECALQVASASLNSDKGWR